MKKILGMLSVAAMILVACDEKNGGNGQDPADYNYTEPRLEAPANSADHFGMTVDSTLPQDGMKSPEGQPAKAVEVNVPPGNTGTVSFNDNQAPREFNYQVSKVAAGLSLITDKVFDRIDIVSQEGNAISLKVVQNGKEIPLSGALKGELPYTPYRQDVCRTWEVETTFVILKMNGKSVLSGAGAGVRFDGCKLSEISKELAKHVKIKTLSTDYDVRKVMIDPCGKFGIFFEGKDPFYGDYSLKGTEFSYHFDFYDNDNPVIAGDATGKLIATNGKGRLTLSAEMEDTAKEKYTVEVTLVMKTAKSLPS